MSMAIKPGQIWRDTTGDGRPRPTDRGGGTFRNGRTVRVIELQPDGRWVIQMITDWGGHPPKGKGRCTRVQPSTLLGGYEFQSDGEGR